MMEMNVKNTIYCIYGICILYYILYCEEKIKMKKKKINKK